MAHIEDPFNLDTDDDAVFAGLLMDGLVWIEDDDDETNGYETDDVLEVAHEVIKYLFKKKLPKYKRRFVIHQLKDDIRGWIQEVIPSLPLTLAHQTNFILCGFEPLKRRPLTHQDGTAGISEFYERHTYIYTIRSKGKVDVKQEKDQVAVIGSGAHYKKEILGITSNFMDFVLNVPSGNLIRDPVIYSEINELLKNQTVIRSVGGPFIFDHIGPPFFYQFNCQWGESPAGVDNISVKVINDHLHVFNKTTQNTRKLFTLEQWFNIHPNRESTPASEIG